MTDATLFRRTLVVDRATVTRNLAILKERVGVDNFVVWTGRLSGARFLNGFRAVADEMLVTVVDGDNAPDNEIRINQILGGHPELRCAVALETHLFGLRTVSAGDGVSYGARFVAPESMPVGLAPIGFADGIDRKLTGVARVRVGNIEVPVIGRIAMDSMSLDLREIDDPKLGDTVTLFGSTSSEQWGIADAAEALGVLPVEIITRLSERAEVVWR